MSVLPAAATIGDIVGDAPIRIFEYMFADVTQEIQIMLV